MLQVSSYSKMIHVSRQAAGATCHGRILLHACWLGNALSLTHSVAVAAATASQASHNCVGYCVKARLSLGLLNKYHPPTHGRSLELEQTSG